MSSFAFCCYRHDQMSYRRFRLSELRHQRSPGQRIQYVTTSVNDTTYQKVSVNEVKPVILLIVLSVKYCSARCSDGQSATIGSAILGVGSCDTGGKTFACGTLYSHSLPERIHRKHAGLRSSHLKRRCLHVRQPVRVLWWKRLIGSFR